MVNHSVRVATSLLATVLLAVPGNARGDEPIKVIVGTVDGPSHAGVIESWVFGQKLALQVATGQKMEIEAADLDEIECLDRKRVSPSGPWEVLLRDDGRWFGEILGGDEHSLSIRNALAGRQRVAVDEIASVARREVSRRLPPPGDEDVAVLANGDTARGSVARFTQESVVLTVGGGERVLPWKGVAALVLAAPASHGLPQRTALVALCDSSRMNVVRLTWGAASVETVAIGGEPTSLRPQDIAHIELRGGRRTWLGSLAPGRYEGRPFLDKNWPLQVDQNVMGGPLSVAGRAYRRGIGLHSACRVTWELGGRYQKFRGAVGMDDSAGTLADADLVVSVDGRVMAEHRHLKPREAPRPIDVDVAGAKELTLEVGFGRMGHVQDRVNLVNAALIAK
jgi:hypothetical protein